MAGRLILTAVPNWESTKVTVGFNSKGALLLPTDAAYTLGKDGAHSTRVRTVTIGDRSYNEFTNPQSFIVIVR